MKRIPAASHLSFLGALLIAAVVAAAPSSAQPPTPAPPPSPAPAVPTPTQTPTTRPTTLNAAQPRQAEASTLQPLQVTDENRTMILLLLDRIQTLAGQSVGESKSGKVAIDRATIDEIVADVSQIKTILQR